MHLLHHNFQTLNVNFKCYFSIRYSSFFTKSLVANENYNPDIELNEETFCSPQGIKFYFKYTFKSLAVHITFIWVTIHAINQLISLNNKGHNVDNQFFVQSKKLIVEFKLVHTKWAIRLPTWDSK